MPADLLPTDPSPDTSYPALPIRAPPLSRNILVTAVMLWQRTRIVSYPSSGRTWLRVMLAELGAWPRFTHSRSRFRSGSTPETVASDLSRHYHRRVLFLLRDPRDTLASNYNHITQRHNWQGDFKTFIRLPHYGLERMLVFHTGWLTSRARFKGGFRVETYEDLHADTTQTLARIAEFVGVRNVALEEFEAVAARNQVERMRQREISGELEARYAARFGRSDPDDPLARRVRRGRVGGHAEDMDAEDLAYCAALMEKYHYAELVAEVRMKQKLAS